MNNAQYEDEDTQAQLEFGETQEEFHDHYLGVDASEMIISRGPQAFMDVLSDDALELLLEYIDSQVDPK